MDQMYQLMITPEGEMTDAQKLFMSVHRDIVACGQAAADLLYRTATDLKRMRDEKLYLSAGFETFEQYTEDCLNIKRRQAYNYISIVEKLPAGYVQSNAQAGIAKLALIASASEQVRDELAEVKLDDVSVRDLKARVAELQAQLDEKEKQLSMLPAEDSYKSLFEKQVGINNRNRDEWRKEIEAKKAEIEVLKKRPAKEPDVIYQEDPEQAHRIAALERENADLRTEKSEESKRVEDLKERVAALEAEREAEREQSQKSPEMTPVRAEISDAVKTFGVKYEDLQRINEELSQLLHHMTEDEAVRCRKAWKEELEAWA